MKREKKNETMFLRKRRGVLPNGMILFLHFNNYNDDLGYGGKGVFKTDGTIKNNNWDSFFCCCSAFPCF